MGVCVSVQASPESSASWAELARAVEVGGFHALYAADHPGTTASPFVALAAAAAVTERIELGTCVANAGVWGRLRWLADLHPGPGLERTGDPRCRRRTHAPGVDCVG